MADPAQLLAQALSLMNKPAPPAEDVRERLAVLEQFVVEASTAMADLVRALENRSDDAIVRAIRDLKLRAEAAVVHNRVDVSPTPLTVENNINVQPTPVNFEAVLPPVPPPEIRFLPAPEPKGGTWKVTLPGQYGAPDRVMTIERIA